MKYRVVHKRRIREIRELTRKVHTKGIGKDAEFHTEKLGFAALLEPGFDLYYIGDVNPGFKPGQAVSIVLEGIIPDASIEPTS